MLLLLLVVVVVVLVVLVVSVWLWIQGVGDPVERTHVEMLLLLATCG